MIGSNEEGDYSLRISPVSLEDDAVFQCQATGNIDIPGIRSQEAKLTVSVPPASPELTPGPVVKTTAGACRSKNGKPAAEVCIKILCFIIIFHFSFFRAMQMS